jgi:spermidine synthase
MAKSGVRLSFLPEALMTLPSVSAAPRNVQDVDVHGVPAWLYVVFFVSGISGLMYQVVWVRMLGRVLGNTVYAASTVLAAFMAGLALGSYLISTRADRIRRPLLVYGILEMGIGLAALATLILPDWLVPVYRAIYRLAGETRLGLTAGQVPIALAFLLVPTALMGATLPLLSAFGARRHPSFGRCVGRLYAVNTLGAVVGVLASGFVLIGLVGETRTLLIGGALNALVAVVALVRGGWEHVEMDIPTPPVGSENVPLPEEAISRYPVKTRRLVALCFGLNGLVALGLEVVWSRLLPITVGNSIYSFTAMLAVMLTGLVLGSEWGARRVDRTNDPLRLLANVQLASGVAAVFGLWVFQLPLFAYHTHWYGAPANLLVLPLLMVAPFGVCSGLFFPLAARCYALSRSKGGQGIGRLYTVNTLGCIAGALLTGFVFIPTLGTGFTGLSLAAVCLAGGLVLSATPPHGFRQAIRLPQLALLLCFVLLALLSGDVLTRALNRKIAERVVANVVIYRQLEEADATITSLGSKDPASRFRFLLINGQNMTGLAPVTKLMAHLPLALADDPRDALVICFGMGTTFSSASTHKHVKVTAVELVGGVLKCFDDFHPGGSQLFQRPTLRAVVDDGRNYLLMSEQQFDTITVDPAPPLESAGTVNLYSREFFQLCRSHLRPGGVMCLWVPPGPQTEIKMILRTFLDVFGHTHVWAGRELAGFFLVGTSQPLKNIPGKIANLYRSPAVVDDLTAWGGDYDRPEKVLALHLGDETRLAGFVERAPVITDDLPYTEFNLWRYLTNPEFQVELDARKLKEALP